MSGQDKEITRRDLLEIVEKVNTLTNQKFKDKQIDRLVASLAQIIIHETFSYGKFVLNSHGKELILDGLKIENRINKEAAQLILDDIEEAIHAKNNAIQFLQPEIETSVSEGLIVFEIKRN